MDFRLIYVSANLAMPSESTTPASALCTGPLTPDSRCSHFVLHGRHDTRRGISTRVARPGALPSVRPDGQERSRPQDRYLPDDGRARTADPHLDAWRALSVGHAREPA